MPHDATIWESLQCEKAISIAARASAGSPAPNRIFLRMRQMSNSRPRPLGPKPPHRVSLARFQPSAAAAVPRCGSRTIVQTTPEQPADSNPVSHNNSERRLFTTSPDSGNRQRPRSIDYWRFWTYRTPTSRPNWRTTFPPTLRTATTMS